MDYQSAKLELISLIIRRVMAADRQSPNSADSAVPGFEIGNFIAQRDSYYITLTLQEILWR